MREFLPVVLICLICLSTTAQPQYDVLIKGGTVIDPKNNINERRDVAIANGQIAAVVRLLRRE